MVRGSRAIRDHAGNGKILALFEQASKGFVRFMGFADYMGHHFEDRPDVEENQRSAIVFELAMQPATPTQNTAIDPPASSQRLSEKEAQSLSLEELREIAISGQPKTANKKTRRIATYNRSLAVRRYVLKRANGTCEGCGKPAPFVNKKDDPYLEPHHLHRISDGGPDHPDHVVALCPTCHRRVHYGNDGASYNEILINSHS